MYLASEELIYKSHHYGAYMHEKASEFCPLSYDLKLFRHLELVLCLGKALCQTAWQSFFPHVSRCSSEPFSTAITFPFTLNHSTMVPPAPGHSINNKLQVLHYGQCYYSVEGQMAS